MGDRVVLPDREERSRPGPLPGPHLAGLVCPHHPGHARARLPRRHPRTKRTPQRPPTGVKRGNWSQRRTADPVVGQRDPSTTRHARPRPAHLCRAGPSLVTLASATAVPGPRLPLPPPRSLPADMNRVPLQYEFLWHCQPARPSLPGLTFAPGHHRPCSPRAAQVPSYFRVARPSPVRTHAAAGSASRHTHRRSCSLRRSRVRISRHSERVPVRHPRHPIKCRNRISPRLVSRRAVVGDKPAEPG